GRFHGSHSPNLTLYSITREETARMARTQSSTSFSLRGALYRAGAILFALTVLTSVAAWAAPPQRGHARATRSGGNSGPVAPIAGLALPPANATLDGYYAFQTLAVVGNAADGSASDLTENATFSSSNPGVVRIGRDGVAYPVRDGTAEVIASVGGRSARARFTVRNFRTNANLTFENAITPILVKNGCVGSACHGAPNGQAGFKLSFFGYEAQKDWEAIVKGSNGRRID